MEVQRFALKFGLEIFFLYRVISHLGKKFCGKNTLVDSYSRAVIVWKMYWKVTSGHRFDNNFRMTRNFWMPPECFWKYTFRAWIWTQILHYFDGNQKCHCPLNMSYRVTRKTDSNYLLIQGIKNGSPTIRSWIWLGNICLTSRVQSSRNKILGKIYVSG